LRLLRQRGYSAIGTCQTNPSICKTFVDRKNKNKKEDLLPWSLVDQKPTADNLIQQRAWKDSALVLMISTIHEASTTQNTVDQLCRRLAITSTVAKISRAVFQGKYKAYLDVLV
jgi:hypothetical protein